MSNGEDANVGKLVGIALGVAGAVVVITGALWFIYRRYGGCDGWLNGIPPERKMLVFTDVGKLPSAAQPQSRPSNTRASSLVAAAAARPGQQAHRPPPPPQPVTRPASAGRTSAASLPALSVVTETEARPATPGTIDSPRGQGRAYTSTFDGPRVSNAQQQEGPSASVGGAGDASGGRSRPSSAAGRPVPLLGGPGHGATSEQLATLAPGTRPSSAGSSAAAAATAAMMATGASGAAGPSSGQRPSAFAGSGRSTSTGTDGDGPSAPAYHPSLVAAGSVVGGWYGRTSPAAARGPERSLNSQAVEISEALAQDEGDGAFRDSSGGAVGPGSAARGRPPVAGRASPCLGAWRAAVEPEAPGSPSYFPSMPMAMTAAAAAAASAGGAVSGPGSPSRFTRASPASSSIPGGERSTGSGTRVAAASSANGGGASGGAGLPRSPSLQRRSGLAPSRTSGPATRLSSTHLADNAASAGVASSLSRSFTNVGEEGPARAPQQSPGLPVQRLNPPEPLDTGAARGSLERRGSRLGLAAALSAGTEPRPVAMQRQDSTKPGGALGREGVDCKVEDAGDDVGSH